MKIVVIGGGISGLAAAHFTSRQGHSVTVIEPDARPGGVLRSDRVDGFLCEGGAQSILSGDADTALLIEQLGLQDQVEDPLPAARNRFVFWNGKLRAVPSGPWSLLTTSLLSFAGKRRFLRESKIPIRLDPGEESVFDFGVRRIGAEAAERLVAAAVVGIFAGDARTLELRSAFPKMVVLERDFGGLFKGMRAQKKQSAASGKSFSFTDGIETLPRAIAKNLGSNLVNGRVQRLEKQPQGGFTITLDSSAQPIQTDAVIVATGPRETARLLGALIPTTAYLAQMPVAPAVVVHLGFHKDPPPLNAFGFLVARGQGVDLLGCQYETATFRNRGPAGSALLRCVLGGMFAPQVITLSDEALVEKTRAELRTVMNLRSVPDFTRIWRVPQALPQYQVGHHARITQIETEAAQIPNLFILGNGLRGAAVRDCIRNAAAAARQIGAA